MTLQHKDEPCRSTSHAPAAGHNEAPMSLERQIQRWVESERGANVTTFTPAQLSAMDSGKRLVLFRNAGLMGALRYVRRNPLSDVAIPLYLWLLALSDNDRGMSWVALRRLGKLFGRGPNAMTLAFNRLRECGLAGEAATGLKGKPKLKHPCIWTALSEVRPLQVLDVIAPSSKSIPVDGDGCESIPVDRDTLQHSIPVDRDTMGHEYPREQGYSIPVDRDQSSLSNTSTREEILKADIADHDVVAEFAHQASLDEAIDQLDTAEPIFISSDCLLSDAPEEAVIKRLASSITVYLPGNDQRRVTLQWLKGQRQTADDKALLDFAEMELRRFVDERPTTQKGRPMTIYGFLGVAFAYRFDEWFISRSAAPGASARRTKTGIAIEVPQFRDEDLGDIHDGGWED